MDEEPGDLWGLPRPVYDELVASRASGVKQFLLALIFPAILIMGFGLGVLGYRVMSAWQRSNAWDYAATVGGWSVDTDFGIALTAGVFWWIFATALVCQALALLLPMPLKGAFALAGRKTDAESPVGKYYLDRLDPPASAGEALDHYHSHCIKTSGLLNLIVGGLILGTAVFETRRFQVIAPDGLYTSRIFQRSPSLQPWSDVTEVALGCNWTDDGAGLIYEATFEDGTDYRFPDSNKRGEPSWLDAFEKADAAITQGGAAFKRWSWMNRDPMHPKCLRHFGAGGYRVDSRIDRLLRTGKL